MPTNAFSILAFVAFFLPGFVYTETRRTLRPIRSRPGAFEQTISIVSVSVFTNLVVGLLYLLGRVNVWFAMHSPDVEELYEDWDTYVLNGDPSRTAYVFAWFVVYVAACSLLAVLLAQTARIDSIDLSGKKERTEKVIGSIAGPIRADPAWYRVFDAYTDDDERVWVGCSMSDGTYVSGILDYFSTDANETGDRDLLLGLPKFLDRDGEELEAHDIDYVVVSARSVVRIDVSHIPVRTDSAGS